MNQKPVINTRADLDAIAGTPEHAAFVAALKGSLFIEVDTAIYPEGYDRSLAPGAPGYIAPVIQQIEDDTAARRFGFTRAALLSM
ncbi:MAG: hypothetical protein PHE83_05900 [Opitutaceae bacterium]|nr:hypothetical protein [Opitutaceae bacterium]